MTIPVIPLSAYTGNRYFKSKQKPQPAQNRSEYEIHIVVLDRLERVPECDWHDERNRRSVYEECHFSFNEGRRHQIRPLGRLHDQERRIGMVADQLFDITRFQNAVHTDFGQTLRTHGVCGR